MNYSNVTLRENIKSRVGENINFTASGVTNTKSQDRPWMNYYVTADEFFEVLRVAFDDTYGNGTDEPWHPEDMYVNVSCVLEVVTNTLANMANIKSGRPVQGIKEP